MSKRSRKAERRREEARHCELMHRAQHPHRIVIRYEGESMPLTLKAGQKVLATALEHDSTGTQITPDPTNLNWSVDNTQLVTIDPNPDNSATLIANAEGSVTVTVTDEANNLTATDVVTITPADPPPPPVAGSGSNEPGKPVAISISFGVAA